VVLTRFPSTDLTGASLRPAVVVSQGQIGQDLVLAAISSVARGMFVPTDYTVETTHPECALTGLRVTSVIRMHKLAASGTVGHCPPSGPPRTPIAGSSGPVAPHGAGTVQATKEGSLQLHVPGPECAGR